MGPHFCFKSTRTSSGRPLDSISPILRPLVVHYCERNDNVRLCVVTSLKCFHRKSAQRLGLAECRNPTTSYVFPLIVEPMTTANDSQIRPWTTKRQLSHGTGDFVVELVELTTEYEFESGPFDIANKTECRPLAAVKRISKASKARSSIGVENLTLLSGMHHRNIVRYYKVYDFVDEYCIVMEYCEGWTLRKCLAFWIEEASNGSDDENDDGADVTANGKTTPDGGKDDDQKAVPGNVSLARAGRRPDILLSIAQQLRSALCYLHTECRLAHNDIKPENIMVHLIADDNTTVSAEHNEHNLTVQVKLVDFGLAARVSDDGMHVGTHVPGITPLYASPERLRAAKQSKGTASAELSHFGCPADVWSLGCVIFELWTLWRPFVTPNVIEAWPNECSALKRRLPQAQVVVVDAKQSIGVAEMTTTTMPENMTASPSFTWSFESWVAVNLIRSRPGTCMGRVRSLGMDCFRPFAVMVGGSLIADARERWATTTTTLLPSWPQPSRNGETWAPQTVDDGSVTTRRSTGALRAATASIDIDDNTRKQPITGGIHCGPWRKPRTSSLLLDTILTYQPPPVTPTGITLSLPLLPPAGSEDKSTNVRNAPLRSSAGIIDGGAAERRRCGGIEPQPPDDGVSSSLPSTIEWLQAAARCLASTLMADHTAKGGCRGIAAVGGTDVTVLTDGPATDDYVMLSVRPVIRRKNRHLSMASSSSPDGHSSDNANEVALDGDTPCDGDSDAPVHVADGVTHMGCRGHVSGGSLECVVAEKLKRLEDHHAADASSSLAISDDASPAPILVLAGGVGSGKSRILQRTASSLLFERNQLVVPTLFSQLRAGLRQFSDGSASQSFGGASVPATTSSAGPRQPSCHQLYAAAATAMLARLSSMHSTNHRDNTAASRLINLLLDPSRMQPVVWFFDDDEHDESIAAATLDDGATGHTTTQAKGAIAPFDDSSVASAKDDDRHGVMRVVAAAATGEERCRTVDGRHAIVDGNDDGKVGGDFLWSCAFYDQLISHRVSPRDVVIISIRTSLMHKVGFFVNNAAGKRKEEETKNTSKHDQHSSQKAEPSTTAIVVAADSPTVADATLGEEAAGRFEQPVPPSTAPVSTAPASTAPVSTASVALTERPQLSTYVVQPWSRDDVWAYARNYVERLDTARGVVRRCDHGQRPLEVMLSTAAAALADDVITAMTTLAAAATSSTYRGMDDRDLHGCFRKVNIMVKRKMGSPPPSCCCERAARAAIFGHPLLVRRIIRDLYDDDNDSRVVRQKCDQDSSLSAPRCEAVSRIGVIEFLCRTTFEHRFDQELRRLVSKALLEGQNPMLFSRCSDERVSPEGDLRSVGGTEDASASFIISIEKSKRVVEDTAVLVVARSSRETLSCRSLTNLDHQDDQSDPSPQGETQPGGARCGTTGERPPVQSIAAATDVSHWLKRCEELLAKEIDDALRGHLDGPLSSSPDSVRRHYYSVSLLKHAATKALREWLSAASNKLLEMAAAVSSRSLLLGLSQLSDSWTGGKNFEEADLFSQLPWRRDIVRRLLSVMAHNGRIDHCLRCGVTPPPATQTVPIASSTSNTKGADHGSNSMASSPATWSRCGMFPDDGYIRHWAVYQALFAGGKTKTTAEDTVLRLNPLVLAAFDLRSEEESSFAILHELQHKRGVANSSSRRGRSTRTPTNSSGCRAVGLETFRRVATPSFAAAFLISWATSPKSLLQRAASASSAFDSVPFVPSMNYNVNSDATGTSPDDVNVTGTLPTAGSLTAVTSPHTASTNGSLPWRSTITSLGTDEERRDGRNILCHRLCLSTVADALRQHIKNNEFVSGPLFQAQGANVAASEDFPVPFRWKLGDALQHTSPTDRESLCMLRFVILVSSIAPASTGGANDDFVAEYLADVYRKLPGAETKMRFLAATATCWLFAILSSRRMFDDASALWSVLRELARARTITSIAALFTFDLKPQQQDKVRSMQAAAAAHLVFLRRMLSSSMSYLSECYAGFDQPRTHATQSFLRPLYPIPREIADDIPRLFCAAMLTDNVFVTYTVAATLRSTAMFHERTERVLPYIRRDPRSTSQHHVSDGLPLATSSSGGLRTIKGGGGGANATDEAILLFTRSLLTDVFGAAEVLLQVRLMRGTQVIDCENAWSDSFRRLQTCNPKAGRLFDALTVPTGWMSAWSSNDRHRASSTTKSSSATSGSFSEATTILMSELKFDLFLKAVAVFSDDVFHSIPDMSILCCMGAAAAKPPVCTTWPLSVAETEPTMEASQRHEELQTTDKAALPVESSTRAVRFADVTDHHRANNQGDARATNKIVTRFVIGPMEMLRRVGDRFAAQCPYLTAVDLRRGWKHVTVIGAHFLAQCPRLTRIDWSFGGDDDDKALQQGSVSAAPVLGVGPAFARGCAVLGVVNLKGLAFSSIGEAFFESCPQLTGVQWTLSLPSKDFVNVLSTISSGFFKSCTKLPALDVTGCTSVTHIHHDVMADCLALQGMNVATMTRLVTIGNGFLRGAASLTNIQLGHLPSLTTIGDDFLKEAKSLQIVDLSGLTALLTLGKGALSNCVSLFTVTLFTDLTTDNDGPRCCSAVERIGANFVQGCSRLRQVDLSPLTSMLPSDFGPWTQTYANFSYTSERRDVSGCQPTGEDETTTTFVVPATDSWTHRRHETESDASPGSIGSGGERRSGEGNDQNRLNPQSREKDASPTPSSAVTLTEIGSQRSQPVTAVVRGGRCLPEGRPDLSEFGGQLSSFQEETDVEFGFRRHMSVFSTSRSSDSVTEAARKSDLILPPYKRLETEYVL